MKTTDILRRARRSLTQAKARTILTSLAISVGAFTIALAMAAGNGGRHYMDGIVSGAGDMRSIQVTAKQPVAEETDDAPLKVGQERSSDKSNYRTLTRDDLARIQALDSVDKVLPIFGVNVYSLAANGSDEYQGQVSVQYDGTAIELTTGALGENSEIAPGDIVLPHKYVSSFGFDSAEAAVGKTVTVTFYAQQDAPSEGVPETFSRDFRIAAVDKEPTSPLAFYQDEFKISNADGMAISTQQRPADSDETYYTFMVIAREGVRVDEVKQAILSAGEYQAMTFEEFRSSISQMINIVQYGLIGFGVLAIIASIFGIINTQYISVLERTREIGLMKALGMRSRDIGRLFRYEAAWIGFLGGLIGVVLAYLVTLINPIIASALKLEEGTALLQLDILSSAVLIAVLVLVAVVSGYFPSRKAAKLDPIEALRTE